MWVQVPPSVPFELNMKDQHQRSKPETFLVFIIVILAIACSVLGAGCTWTFHREPLKLQDNLREQQATSSLSILLDDISMRYYVIDKHSTTPDAYFETKEEAEKYKIYFKENHNYTVVQKKGVMYER